MAYADIPLLFPEQNLISVKFMESPESPTKALVGSLKLHLSVKFAEKCTEEKGSS
jgi:hypothetical protein